MLSFMEREVWLQRARNAGNKALDIFIEKVIRISIFYSNEEPVERMRRAASILQLLIISLSVNKNDKSN